MIWSIAWKNVWRNKKRSLVVIIAVTIGIIAGVLLVGIMEGWTTQRLHDAIYNEVSHVQIHNNEYLRNEEIGLTVDQTGQVIQSLDSLREISGWVQRTKLVAMAGTPWANAGVVVYGIDPEKEKKITEICRKIVPGGGDYLDSAHRGGILIGDKVADLLKLKQYNLTDTVLVKLAGVIPEPVVLHLEPLRNIRFKSYKEFTEALKKELGTRELNKYGLLITGQALDYRIRNKIQITLSDVRGNPVQGIFRVCGIYKTTNAGFDQASVFVNARELADLYGGNEVLTHEIAILCNSIDDAHTVKEKLDGNFKGNAVRTWRELAPDAAMLHDFIFLYYFVFVGIIMLALAFGIINTMMMAVLERTKELGMLMAIGMNHRRIFSMIMLETIFLTFAGALAGMLLGWAIALALGKTGIHFSGWGEGFEAIGFAARVYPVVKPGFIFFTTLMVIFTALVASVWPARKALKLIPVEALRTE
ncbi:MAG: ABC transporter permease [Bacteroidales bacterium]|nr:ABC transporter permease [Bacteroidales bacterium]